MLPVLSSSPLVFVDLGCIHEGHGQKFGSVAKAKLKVEATGFDGVPRCMYPGCKCWETLEYHHIRPRSAGGRNTTTNGIALCSHHHTLADRGQITPRDLIRIKLGRSECPDTIRDRTVIRSILDLADAEPDDRCDAVYLEKAHLLTCLRACEPNQRYHPEEILRAIARTQLSMAGALCSWLPADLVDRTESERFEIDMHAANAARIGKKLRDPFLVLRANHTRAVNANAQRDFNCARRHAIAADKVRQEVRIRDAEFHAYLTRDLAAILARTGEMQLATRLLGESSRLSDSISDSGGAETLMRAAEMRMLRGDLVGAERLISADLMHSPVLSPIQKVIRARIQATHACLVGHISEGLPLYHAALQQAEAHALGHQAAKIRLAMHHFAPESVALYVD